MELRYFSNHTHTKISLFLFALFFVFVSGLIIFINLAMPLVGEDFSLEPWGYHNAPQTVSERIIAVYQRIYASATLWSPRIGEALTTITAALPDIGFDLINTGFFLWLLILLFALMYGEFPDWKKPSNLFNLFATFFLLITLFPLLGQVFFWKSGACNHLWGAILSLSFILPFRLNLINRISFKRFYTLPLYTIFGFLAGFTVENVSPFVFFYCLIHYIFEYQNKSIDKRFILPILSNAVGVIMLLFLPGTTIRRKYYSGLSHESDFSMIGLYLDRFKRVHADFLDLTWPMLIILLVCFTIFIIILYKKTDGIRRLNPFKKPKYLSLFFLFLLSYLSVLALISISYQSDQSRGFSFFWLIIISITSYLITEIWKSQSQKVMLIILSIMLIFLIFNITAISETYIKFNQENNIRLEIIHAAIKNGKREIALPAITIPSSRVIETREILPDLGERIAAYYNFDLVKIKR